MKGKLSIWVAMGVLALIVGCSPAGGEKRGHEFMPDMVHSVAYEANIYEYYYYNTWGTEDEYKWYATPRKSVEGTIARGAVGTVLAGSPEAFLKDDPSTTSANGIVLPMNGAVPYPYADTEEDRIRASREIRVNPVPITKKGLAEGQALYGIYCAICHGDNADGLGYLVREGDPARGISAGVYPAAPANFTRDVFIDTTDGLFYHSIMYGKNMMGSYADKLSYEERWQVIHYIRSLQAKTRGLQYNEDINTLNDAIPGGPLLAHMDGMQHAEEVHVPADEQVTGHGHENGEGSQEGEMDHDH